MEPWIEWVRRLQVVSETGLEYARDPHDVSPYEEAARLASDVAGQDAGLDRHNFPPHGARAARARLRARARPDLRTAFD
jgi:hypothetical protein